MGRSLKRISVLQVILLAGLIIVLAKAFKVQVIQRAAWQAKSEATRSAVVEVPARRGSILDRNGVPLAVTQERFTLDITRDQLADPEALKRLLVEIGIPRDLVARQFARDANYLYFGVRLSADQIEPIRHLAGVYPKAHLRRVYPLRDLAVAWLGSLDADGVPQGGLEKALDSLLTGTPGRDQLVKDGQGRRYALPGSRLLEPVPGHDVYLTLDNQLQSIAEAELLRALESIPARGGDVVILDVHRGEILAMASYRTSPQGESFANTAAVNEPSEPGSTAKIFTAAALLREKVDSSPVPGHNGRWAVPGINRVIQDVHAERGDVSLGETIKVSSNIGISQFALRLEPTQLYRALRDFGFGTPPGIGFPSEASGVLRRPPWTSPLFSATSLGQGYEFEATSLQMAAAYAPIGNGGNMMTTSLLREVRTSGRDSVLWRYQPMPLRRVVTDEVAARLRDYLRLATDSGGSGAQAQLEYYSVIGKTATAKVAPYRVGDYRAAFAGLFPGDNPQIVVYMMIDHPGGAAFYGGLVTAPLVRHMLQQALAVDQSPLDRQRLDRVVSLARSQHTAGPSGNAVQVVSLPYQQAMSYDTATIVIPEVIGLSSRQASALLLRDGLQVRLEHAGIISGTIPQAGVRVNRGTLVTLLTTVGR